MREKKKKKRRKGGSLMMLLGVALLCGAFVLARNNLLEERSAADASRAVLTQLVAALPAQQEAAVQPVQPVQPQDGVLPLPEKLPLFVRQPEMEMPVAVVDGEEYIGVLEIPRLSLSLPIMSDWSYPQLKIAPCRYAGSIYNKDCVIAGHNYAEHFGALWQLQVGDEVRFTDVDGNVFLYDVALQEILAPYEVEEMLAEQWDLSLFTCKTGGRTRVTIRCMMKGYIEAQTAAE